MAWPKLRNKSSGPLMTVSNRSGAAHDGARSQGKAPEGAPEGPTRLPFLRAQGARVTEGSKGPERVEGPEAVRAEAAQDAPVTWPGQAADEAASYQGTAAEETAADVAETEATG